MIEKHKINILMGGQYGSEGKGNVASFIANRFGDFTIAATNNGPNAGHTFYIGDKEYTVSQLPVSGIINRDSKIVLSAGSVLDIDKLVDELKEFDISKDRLCIHPRAAIVTDEDKRWEEDNLAHICSVKSGNGRAIVNKLMRRGRLVEHYKDFTPYVHNLYATLNKKDNTIFMEMSQGMDLSINNGFSYPYCTSREISVSQALSDMGCHPHDLGKVIVAMRTFPIRVGSTKDNTSGPHYADQQELDWDTIGIKPEYSSVSKKKRRLFSFSTTQYNKVLKMCRPDHLILTFGDYLSETDLSNMLNKYREFDHVSYGPKHRDIIDVWRDPF